MKARTIAISLCGILLASCASVQHDVTITAKAPLTSSSIGTGVTIGSGLTVALNVIDDRDDVVVGHRGVGTTGADITANDVMAALARELARGLEAQGFAIVPGDSDADATLEVKLRTFKFLVRRGMLARVSKTTVYVNVRANTNGKEFNERYRINREESRIVNLGGSKIDRELNNALSHILAEIMWDDDLMSFLAQRSITILRLDLPNISLLSRHVVAPFFENTGSASPTSDSHYG